MRTSPHYPESNGKIRRWHKTLKRECIRPGTPLTFDDARCLLTGYVAYCNTDRLHSSIGHVTPKDKLDGRDTEYFQVRAHKLTEARDRRRAKRQPANDQQKAGNNGSPATTSM
jgi:putative transposase